MKGSVSAPSEPTAFFLKRRLFDVAALAYLLPQLALLAPSLEDIDSINFALGLRDFDVAQHQPHPPGYALYVGLGRASLAVLRAVGGPTDGVRAEAIALAIWSAIGAAVAFAAAVRVYRALTPRAAAPAAVLLAAAPLFWISAIRPMSDMPGLAAALVTQALLLRAGQDRRALAAGALAAGLAAGIRIQTLWLTVPVIVLVIARQRAGLLQAGLRAAAAGTAGVLAWAIPLVMASGGLSTYVQALGSQAGEDLTVIDMLWLNPTPRRLAFSLYETFVMPWGPLPLAIAVGACAAIGIAVAALRERRALGLMALVFGPYVVFHLLFQETVHVRYALPVLVPVAWLAAQGTALLGRAAPIVHGAVIAAAITVSSLDAIAYSGEAHPAFRAIADMTRASAVERPAAIFSHYSVRRPLQVWAPQGLRVVEPPRQSEWRDLLAYWRGGATAPVWFLADTRRTDLALVDPQSRRNVTKYTWRVRDRPQLSGVRPADVDWYRLDPPAWFAGDGWALTPELGGVAERSGTGVDRRPLEAMVRRRPERTFAVVGARHLGTAAAGGVEFSLSIDGRRLDRWSLDPATGANVLRVLELPAGTLAGAGAYARLEVAAQPLRPGDPTPPVAVRQFDLQSETGLIHAFDEGWHEEEYDNATGLRWRWTSGRSLLRIVPPQGVRLRLRGESPLRYFASPPAVRISAAGTVVATFHPDSDFDWTVTVPASEVRKANGFIAIETAPVYLPGLAEGTTDQRQLGLRLFAIDVDQVMP